MQKCNHIKQCKTILHNGNKLIANNNQRVLRKLDILNTNGKSDRRSGCICNWSQAVLKPALFPFFPVGVSSRFDASGHCASFPSLISV